MKLLKQFIVGRHLRVGPEAAVSSALSIVCPLGIHTLVEVHQNGVLRLQLTVEYTLHMSVSA